MFFVVLSEENPDKRLHRSTESASSKDDSLHTSRDDLCNIRLEQDERPLRDSTLDLSGASKSPSTPNYRLSAAAAAADMLSDNKAALLSAQYGRTSCQYASSFGSPSYGLSPPSFGSQHSMYPYAAAHHASLSAGMSGLTSQLAATTSALASPLTSQLDTSALHNQMPSCQQLSAAHSRSSSYAHAHAHAHSAAAGLGYNMAAAGGINSSALSPCALMPPSESTPSHQSTPDPSAMNLKLKHGYTGSLL